MPRITSLLLFLLLALATQAQQSIVRVAAASSLMPAMKEIKQVFESKYAIEVELIPGASGTLASQVMHGAPFDLFISANKKYSQTLSDEGFCKLKPIDWIRGELVIWSDKPIENMENTVSSQQIADLLQHPDTKTIALAQPKLAPYGDAARLFMDQLGVFSQIQDKIIYGNNISITNQYIYTGAANLVFTSLASKIALSDQVGGYWYELTTTSSLIHSLCLIEPTDQAQEFLKFLQDTSNFDALRTYGYIQL